MKTLGFVFKYAKQYTTALIITVVSMLLLVGAQLVAPWLVREMVSIVTDPASGPDAMETITRLALIALGVYVARGGLRFVRSYVAHIAGWGVVADVRQHIYEHLQQLSLRFYEDKQTGQLMSRLVNDSDKFERLISHAVPDVIVNVMTFFGVSAILFSMNPRLLLLSMIPIPFIVLTMQGFSKFVRPAFRIRQEKLGDLNALLNDNISGIQEIKAFTREEIEANRIWRRIAGYRDSLLNALRLMATVHPFVEFASSLGTIVLIYFGGRLALQQTLPIEDLVAFFLYLDMFYQPIRQLSTAWENVQEALAGADRVAELLNEEPDMVERADAVTLTERARGDIVLRDVTFAYDEGERVLEDIDLEIPAGHEIGRASCRERVCHRV